MDKITEKFLGLLLLLALLPTGCGVRSNVLTTAPPSSNQGASAVPGISNVPTTAPPSLGNGEIYHTQTIETQRQLPNGFVDKTIANAGTGKVLIAQRAQAYNVSDLLLRTLDELATYFNDRPRIIAGFVDTFNNTAQGIFTATMDNQPIKGMTFASLKPEGGTVWIVFDHIDALGNSFESLIQSLPGSQSGQTVQFPDGSGSVWLPEGWSLTVAEKGAMKASGPDGAWVAFGQWFPINLPGSINTPGSERLLFAPYAPPDQAVFLIDQEIRRVYQGQGPDPTLRLVEEYSVPSPIPSGEAAFLHLTSEPIVNGQTQLYRSLASVITFATSPTTWIYYYSQIIAPDPVFRQQFSVMQKIWNSYKVANGVYQARLDEALNNMREIGEIIKSMPTTSEPVRDNAQLNWIEYIRNETLIKDTQFDEVHSASLDYVNELVGELNRQEGGNRYQVMPFREYYGQNF